MTMRKKTFNQQISDLKNEIETVEKFMAPKIRESIRLDEIRKTRQLTKEELKKADELIEYIHEKNCWLVKANEMLGAKFAPAN